MVATVKCRCVTINCSYVNHTNSWSQLKICRATRSSSSSRRAHLYDMIAKKLHHFKIGWNGKTDLRSHELWGATTVDWHISLTLDYNNNIHICLFCCLLFVVLFFFVGLYLSLTSFMNWSKSPECPLPDQSQLSSLENWTLPWKLAFSNVIWFDQTHRLTQTMLFGLMSRWMMSLSCMNTIPETTCSQEDWLIKFT